MSPLASTRAKNCSTIRWWRGSVVRIRRLLLICQRSQSSRYWALTPSQWAWGLRPAASAVRWIFWPCSSQPVMNTTRSPFSR